MDSEGLSRDGSLLERLAAGDDAAREELLPMLYGELHRIASSLMVAERVDHSLQPTALIHEAWLRLFGAENTLGWQGERQFLSLAGQTMRRVLVDYARSRQAIKRGHKVEIEGLEEWLKAFDSTSIDVLTLHELIEELASFDEELAKLVELRFFVGLTVEQTAHALETSVSSVERGWRTARAWLQQRLRA